MKTFLLYEDEFETLMKDGKLKITPKMFSNYLPESLEEFKMFHHQNPRKIRIDYEQGIQRIHMREELSSKYEETLSNFEIPPMFFEDYIDRDFVLSNNMREAIQELCERKQVGIIYHYTTIESFLALLKGRRMYNLETDPFEFYSLMKYGISCSRNYCLGLNKDSADISHNRGYVVRIAIDGTKLSDRYKIRPVNGFSTRDGYEEDPFQKSNSSRMSLPKKSEQEEFIYFKGAEELKTIKLVDYIKDIEILNLKEIPEEISEEIKIHSKSFKFPISFVSEFKSIKG